MRNFDRSIFCDLFDNVPPLINKDQDAALLHAISEEERLTVTLRYLAADNICIQGMLQHRVVSVFLQRNVPPLKARWPVRAVAWTGDRTVPAWFESHFASELCQFRLPRFASVFRRRHKKPSVPSIWCLCQGKNV